MDNANQMRLAACEIARKLLEAKETDQLKLLKAYVDGAVKAPGKQEKASSPPTHGTVDDWLSDYFKRRPYIATRATGSPAGSDNALRMASTAMFDELIAAKARRDYYHGILLAVAEQVDRTQRFDKLTFVGSEYRPSTEVQDRLERLLFPAGGS